MCVVCTRKIDVVFDLIDNILKAEHVFREMLDYTKTDKSTEETFKKENIDNNYVHEFNYEIIHKNENEFILTKINQNNLQESKQQNQLMFDIVGIDSIDNTKSSTTVEFIEINENENLELEQEENLNEISIIDGVDDEEDDDQLSEKENDEFDSFINENNINEDFIKVLESGEVVDDEIEEGTIVIQEIEVNEEQAMDLEEVYVEEIVETEKSTKKRSNVPKMRNAIHYECNICQSIFKRKDTYESHMAKHSGLYNLF